MGRFEDWDVPPTVGNVSRMEMKFEFVDRVFSAQFPVNFPISRRSSTECSHLRSVRFFFFFLDKQSCSRFEELRRRLTRIDLVYLEVFLSIEVNMTDSYSNFKDFLIEIDLSPLGIFWWISSSFVFLYTTDLICIRYRFSILINLKYPLNGM